MCRPFGALATSNSYFQALTSLATAMSSLRGLIRAMRTVSPQWNKTTSLFDAIHTNKPSDGNEGAWMIGPILLTILSFAVDERSNPVDWPQLYGSDDALGREKNLNLEWGEKGPPELWRMEVGTGYSQPVIADGKLILFHRKGDQE